MTTSNFAAGVTHMPCRVCEKPVDVRPESDEWNENPRWVAHRLCQNSMPEYPGYGSDRWDEIKALSSGCYRIGVKTLERLWFMVRKQSSGKMEPWDGETKKRIVLAAERTVKWGTCRQSVYAARFLILLRTRQWNKPFIVTTKRSSQKSRSAKLARDRRNGQSQQRGGN